MRKYSVLFAVAILVLLLVLQGVTAQDEKEIKPGEKITLTVEHDKMSAPLFVQVGTDHIYAEVVIRMKPLDNQNNFDPDLYVKIGSAPTKNSSDRSDLTVEDEHIVVFRSPADQIVAGTKYYMAAHGHSRVSGSIEFSVELNSCLYNCNNRGECLPPEDGDGDFKCKCNAGFTEDPHCRVESKDAEINSKHTGKLSREQIVHYKIQAPVAKKEGYLRAVVRRTSPRGNGITNIYANKGVTPTINRYQEVAFLYGFAREAVINVNARTYSDGTWYISLFAPTRGTLEYSIEIEYFNCARNCSNHGKCDVETSTCECEKEYNLLPDCSIRSRKLDFAQTQEITLEPSESTYFNLEVSEGVFNMNAEIGFHLKAKIDDPEKPPRGVGWPTMYLNQGREIPSASNFMMTSPRPGSWNQTFYIPDSKVFQGPYTFVVANTGYSSYEYELTARVRPHCPFGCENNGYCDNSGQCKCKQGIIGGACDITKSKCDKIVGVHHGLSGFVLFMLVIIFASLAAAISIFIYTKFWYVESDHQAPELQYDPLNE